MQENTDQKKQRIWTLFTQCSSDYGDIIYGKTNNESFKNKIENVQYKAFQVTSRKWLRIFRR